MTSFLIMTTNSDEAGAYPIAATAFDAAAS
jgi:hypothetical protein